MKIARTMLAAATLAMVAAPVMAQAGTRPSDSLVRKVVPVRVGAKLGQANHANAAAVGGGFLALLFAAMLAFNGTDKPTSP